MTATEKPENEPTLDVDAEENADWLRSLPKSDAKDEIQPRG